MKYEGGEPDWKKPETLKIHDRIKNRCPRIEKRIKRVLKAEKVRDFEITYDINEGTVLFKVKEPEKQEKVLPVSWEDVINKSPRYVGEVLGNLYVGKLNEFFGNHGTKL